MFIAEEKFETNIAEYVIYMFQVEDMLRGYQLDLEKITENLIKPQVKDELTKTKITNWYKEIIREMVSRKLQEKGHLFRVNEVLTEMVYLHNTLINIVKDEKYLGLIANSEEHIQSFRRKSGLKEEPIVVVCFQAIYMKLLLKLRKAEISVATEEAFDAMRIILAYLARIYHQMKAGDMSSLEIKPEN